MLLNCTLPFVVYACLLLSLALHSKSYDANFKLDGNTNVTIHYTNSLLESIGSSSSSSSSSPSLPPTLYNTFGTSVGSQPITTTETTLFDYTLSSTAIYGVTTEWWSVSADPSILQTAIWRYYIDFETTSSISFVATTFTGMGFNDYANVPWGNSWIGVNTFDGGYYNKIRIPFYQHLRVTVQGVTLSGPNVIWFKVEGVENLPIVLGNVTIPYGARLIQQSQISTTVQPLQSIPIVNLSSGFIVPFYQVFIISTNSSAAFTGQFSTNGGLILSSNTYSYFNSSLLNNDGLIRTDYNGFTDLSPFTESMFYINDISPIIYSNGLVLNWQNGLPNTYPGVSTVSTYSYNYQWISSSLSALTPLLPNPSATFAINSNFLVNSTNETIIYSQTLGSNQFNGTITYWSIFGTPATLIDTTIWRFYIDGEIIPSISVLAAYYCGVGFGDQTQNWGNTLFGKTSSNGGWFNTLVIPYYISIQITVQINPINYPSFTSSTIQVVLNGSINAANSIYKRFVLPSGSTLHQSTINNFIFSPLAYINYASKDHGNGVIAYHVMIYTGATTAAYEGCYRLFTTYINSTFPGIPLSSGTEDYYDSGYNYLSGTYRQDNAGATHISNVGGYSASQYRLHFRDPLFFNNGFRFMSRVGENLSPSTGMKCFTPMTSTGNLPPNNPVGGSLPYASTITAYTFYYVFNTTITNTMTLPNLLLNLTLNGNLNDLSLNHEIVTCSSGCTFISSPFHSNGRQILSTNGIAPLVTSILYPLTMTLSGWIYFTSSPTSETIFSAPNSQGSMNILISNSLLTIQMSASGTTVILWQDQYPIQQKTLYYITFTMDVYNTWTFYLNGKWYAQGFLYDIYLTNWVHMTPQMILIASNPFTGYLFDIVIYDNILTQSQVLSLYTNEFNELGTPLFSSSSTGSSSSSSSTGSSLSSIPFYNNISNLIWYYPLTSNYIDLTGQSTGGVILSNGGCASLFQSMMLPTGLIGTAWTTPCDDIGEGILVTGGITLTNSFSITVAFQWIVSSKSSGENFAYVLGCQTPGNGCVDVYYDYTNSVLHLQEWGFPVGATTGVLHLINNTWYHLGVTYNDTSLVSIIYLNGVNVGSQTASYTYSNTTHSLSILGGHIGGDYDWVGSLLYYRAFNIVLNQTQIQTMYNLDLSIPISCSLTYPSQYAYLSQNLINFLPLTQSAVDCIGNVTDTIFPIGTGSCTPSFTFNGWYQPCDSPNQAIKLNGNPLTNSYSISAWFQINATTWRSTGYTLIGQTDYSPENYVILYPTGIASTHGLTDFADTGSCCSFLTNSWYHIVITYDSTPNYIGKIYLNNTLLSATTTSSGIWDIDSHSYIYIGGMVGDYNLQGFLKSIRIYNYSIPLSMVTDLYNFGQ
jgi:hypothetical protein